MERYDVLELLGQVEIEEAGQALRDFLRGVARDTIMGVMAQEVEMLCGPAYYPHSKTNYSRAGSAMGSALFEGRRQKVKRPRVRLRKADGSTAEAKLLGYRAAREPGELHAMLLRALTGGVSARATKSARIRKARAYRKATSAASSPPRAGAFSMHFASATSRETTG